VQPIKELSSAAGRCTGRGCVLIRQLANVGHALFTTHVAAATINTLLIPQYFCHITLADVTAPHWKWLNHDNSV